MEVDPTSTGDVGGSGDFTAEQPLQQPPAITPSNDVELLKKEKAELEREIFTVKAELDDMKEKYHTASRSKEEARQEYQGISRQFEERNRLFRDLQVTNERLLTQKGDVDQECLSVKRERDEKELLLKRANKEKQLIAVEVQSLKEQLKDLSSQKKELEMQRRTMEKFQQDARMECQRAIDEKAVYEESKRWFMNELADRDNKIAHIRLEHSGKEVSWQSERLRLVDEKNRAVSEVEDIKLDLVLKQRLLDESNEKLRGIGESHEAQLTTLKDEVANRECLIRTVKDQMNKADEASIELKNLNDKTSALLQSANEEIERAKLDTASQIENGNIMVAERDRLIAELKDELEKANDLIKNKHNLTLSDEAIEELSPAAAVASRLLKSGGSLTAIYREHAKLAAQLEEERARSRLTEESFQEVIGQLTERAPQLILQKEQLEKYIDESYRLENQLRDADEQRKQLMEERDYASRELAFTKGELERHQRDYSSIMDRMANLVFALEKERSRPDRGTSDADDDNEEEDARKFRDIKSLTRRNQELESELRTEKARTHQLAREEVEEATERLTRDRAEMQRDLEMQRTQCMKLESALEGRQHALDSYKNIVEGGGLGGESVIVKRQLEQKIAELNEAQQNVARLEEWRANDKEDREKMMAVYEDRIKQHMAIVSESKRGYGKMESELELQKQTAMETYKEMEKQTRKWERAVEAEQKAKEMVAATEQKVAGLHANLMQMQGQLSSLGVERRSLDEQLKMSQSNEMRLRAELDARAQNHYHNDMMMNMMAEMEGRMNAVEMTKKEAMEIRLESLENERDQLKTSNAALVERNERLERERGAEVAKLNTEKLSLESQFMTEKNERIAAESETNELRAKLVATQKHFTAVDESIGSNPERLAQECQKLKNDNKFLEGQMEELKKRAEMADASAKRSEEELNRLSALSSTVETTLVDTTRAGTLEQERLKGILEAEQLKANNLWNEVNRLKEEYTTLLNSSNETKNVDNSTILQLEQKISVLEMNLREESAKGEGFDARMKGVNDEKAIVMGQLNEVNEQLMGVRGELEEIRLEKEAASEKVTVLEVQIASMEGRMQEESNIWMGEKMRMEGEYKRLEMESEGQTARYEEEIKRKGEQIEQIMSSVREVDGSSMEVEGINQMSAVNRYLREEQQKAMERMMRAEVERKRFKVQNDELEGERMRLERRIKDLEAKSEADSTALADMANLRVKLEISVNIEKELIGMKEERDKLTKIGAELQRKLTIIGNEKNKLMEEVKNLKETIGTLTNDNGVKMRETNGLKKTIQDKENELIRLRAELAKKAAVPMPVGGGAQGRMAQQLKIQLEAVQKELAETKETSKKELDAATEKANHLRRIAIKYKNDADAASSSTGTVQEAGTSQNMAAEGMLNTPPSNIAIKRLQEEKDKLEERLKEIMAEKDSIEGERDEIKFRQSSINSMLEKAKNQKDVLAKENAELKKRLAELGILIESSGPLSQSGSPTKQVTSPIKTISSVSSASISQSTPDVTIQAPPPSSVVVSSSPTKAVVAMEESEEKEEKVDAPIAVSTVSTASAPSDPAPPTTSTNIFGSGNIDWPDKMSRIGSTSTSTSTTATPSSISSLGGHPSLFGRSAPSSSSSIPTTRVIPDVSTSSSIPDVPSFSAEWKVEEEQPISSSSSGDTSRKRGASDDRMEMKRARVEDDDDEDEGANDVITSSHRGNDLDDVMVEDDTRDGEVEDEERKGEEQVLAEVPVDEEVSRDSVVIDDNDDDEEEEDGEDDIEVIGDENDEEDDSQRDEEMEDPDNEDMREMRRGMGGEVVNVDDDDDEDEVEEVEVEEEGDVSDDEDDEDDEDEEEEEDDNDEDDEDEDEGGEEMDRGSESDGEVEGDGEIDEDVMGRGDGEDRDEGREAIASMEDEADEEGVMSGENPSAKSESNEGEKKKRSPIVWKGEEEQEECSSSNESGRPSTSTASVSNVWRGRGARGGSAARAPRPPPNDLATNLMRLGGRGRGSGGGAQRGKRGGGQGN